MQQGYVSISQGSRPIRPTRTVTTETYAITQSDVVVLVNRAGVVTITIPSAEIAKAGRGFLVKDISGAASCNNITVDVEGCETIDGGSTDVINTDYGSAGYVTDGTSVWKI
jgi:hypothetical protein